MLLYSPPFLMVGPVTVFPDHADPEAFYYIVSVPELVTDNGAPAFWATAILPPASVGTEAAGNQGVGRAYVSFDTHLPLPPDPDDMLSREIQKRWGRTPKRLVPAPLQAGTVTLTVARPNAIDPSKQFFAYTGHAPTLVGDNRAALAVAADGDEAQALVAAVSVGHLAGVVTYELEFPGLAPSFEASMVVHWSKVYERFREHDTTNFVIKAEEIDTTVERLEDSHAIEITVKELDPDGAKAATRALFDELKSEVVKKLFESPLPTGDTPIEERIGRGVRDVLTSLMPGVSHTLRRLDQSALTDMTIDLREQQVNTYKFYPQSTLAGLLDRAGHAANRLAFVRIEDLPNRIEEVMVEIAGGSARLGVRGADVRVEVTSPGRAEPLADETVHINAATPERKAVRFRRLGTEEPVVRCQVTMFMDPAVAAGGKERWTFDWRPVAGHRIWFDPEEWLDVKEVRAEIDDPAIFDVARVGVDMEAWLPGESAPLRTGNLQFTKETLSQPFAVVVPDGQSIVFKAKETFRRTGEADFVRAIPSIAGAVHRIMNPFGQSWTMEVRAVSAWTDTLSLIAEFRVWDVLRKTWLLDQHEFTKAAATFTLKFSASLETPRKAEVRVSRATAAGVVRGPWRDLSGPIVSINDTVVAERRIRATLSTAALQRAGVKKVFVDLEYKDGDQSPVAAATLELARDGAFADWVHPFADPTHPFYKYRVRARGEGGERYTGAWTETGADDLTITLPDNPWAS